MNVSFQLDEVSSLNYQTDSSLPIIYESQKRKNKNYVFKPEDVSFYEDKVYAAVNEIIFHSAVLHDFSLSKKKLFSLDKSNFLFIRQDPPYDMTYVTSLHLLELLNKKVKIVNDPIGIRNSPEKLLMLKFPEIIPSTIITRSVNEVDRFTKKFSKSVIKPLYGNGGESVFLLDRKDKNYNQIIESFVNNSSEPFIVQEYLSEIKNGDKRIIIVNGNPVAGIKRMPQNNEIRSNIHVGGTAITTKLNKNDLKICKIIKKELLDNNLFFVGIDVIGNYLTEINVTSPTCIQEIKKLNKIDIAKIIWDELLVV